MRTNLEHAADDILLVLALHAPTVAFAAAAIAAREIECSLPMIHAAARAFDSMPPTHVVSIAHELIDMIDEPFGVVTHDISRSAVAVASEILTDSTSPEAWLSWGAALVAARRCGWVHPRLLGGVAEEHAIARAILRTMH